MTEYDDPEPRSARPEGVQSSAEAPGLRDVLPPGRELINVFFYGLFMDVDIVRAAGVDARVVGRGSVSGFALRIGRRAVLVPEAGATTEGVAMAMWSDEVRTLYASPGLAGYEPRPILVVLEGAEPLDAIVYNAPFEPGQRDEDYVRRLREAARKAGLPEAYAASIE